MKEAKRLKEFLEDYDDDSTGLPITRIETLANGLFNRDRLGYANIFSSEKYSQYILDSGDLLFSHINSKQYIGRTVLYVKQEQEEIIHGMNLLRLKVIPDILSPHFIYYYFKSPFIKEQIASHRKDAVNQSSISISDLKRITLYVPPLPEQQQIVSELDCLQGIIDKKKEQLQELDKLAQSIFYTMFGDPVENEKGWDIQTLKTSTTKIGSGATPKGGNDNYKENGISLIRSLNVHNNSFKMKELAFIDEEQANGLKNVIIERNDVLLNITGASVARCCVVPSNILPARVNQHVSILRAQKNILNHIFLCYQLTSVPFQTVLIAMSKANGATREALTKTQVGNIKIILPPLPLQQEFADKINAIEQQKARIQQSLQDTETLFQSRMDYYFD